MSLYVFNAEVTPILPPTLHTSPPGTLWKLEHLDSLRHFTPGTPSTPVSSGIGSPTLEIKQFKTPTHIIHKLIRN